MASSVIDRAMILELRSRTLEGLETNCLRGRTSRGYESSCERWARTEFLRLVSGIETAGGQAQEEE